MIRTLMSKLSVKLTLEKKQQILGIMVVLPALLLLIFVIVIPWIRAFAWSFHDYSPLFPDRYSFVGFKNYISIFNDNRAIKAIINTFIFVTSVVTSQFILGLIVSMALNTDFFGKRIVQVLILMPMMLPPAIVGLLWKFMYDDRYGIINFFIRILGYTPIGWLTSPSHTLISIIIVEIWQFYPFLVLIILAGLHAMPQEILEAAAVDGASSFNAFLKVIFPLLIPVISIGLLFRLMLTTRSFAIAFAFFESSGGPGNSALLLPVYLYRTLFANWDFGRASAISYLILIITLVFCLPLIKAIWTQESK